MVDKEKLTDFWVSLFNTDSSCSTIEEAEKILNEVSGMCFDDCIKEYCCKKEKLYNINYVEYDALITCFNHIKDSKKYRWIYFYYGIVSDYYNEIIDILESGKELIKDKNIFLNNIITHIVDKLNEVAYRSLIVEVNYVKSEGKLIGNTPNERADYFSDVLLRDRKYVASVMDEYPEMVRLFQVKIKNALYFFRKLITDTLDNIGSIETTINEAEKLGRLERVIPGSGDTHNGGQSVARLIFESGKIIIYKPHSLIIDLAYNSVMEKVSDFSESLGYGRFYLPKCFTTGESGWVEFIYNDSEPESMEEIRNYHRKLGILSCVLYVLSAGDMHSENIIALKESPVIIDLETVIQPRKIVGGDELQQNVLDKIFNSVKSTLVFPTYLVNKRNQKFIDLGGVGNVEEQDSPFDNNYIDSIESDNVKLKKQFGKVALNSNVLMKNKKRINAADYYSEISEGFSQMYLYIQKNQSVFKKMLCDVFAECPIRVVYRSTCIYAKLLDLSYHPDLLRNSVDRMIYLHRLGLDKNKDRHMVAKEIEAIRNADIPFFQMSATSKGCDYSENDLYSLSSIENIIEKIHSMDGENLRRQLMIIKSCFGIIPNNNTDFHYISGATLKSKKDKDIENIKMLCDKLFANAISGKVNDRESFSWLGCIENDFGIVECQDVGDSLYYGRSGVAFALYCAYIYTGDEEYLKKADMVMEAVYVGIEAEEFGDVPMGAYDGISGILFLLVFCREKLCRKEKDGYIKKILRHISNNWKNSKKKDVLGGIGGIVKVLSYVCDEVSDKEINEMSVNALKKVVPSLLERINFRENEQMHFIGYAHGEAGIISALVCSDQYISLLETERLIKDSLEFQNKAYSEKANNWSRTIEEQERFNYGWCHGAPGVLLSRVELFHSGIRNPVMMKDIKKSIKAVKEQCFGDNYCLCHGDVGNLLILRSVAQILGDFELIAETEANMNIVFNERIIPYCIDERLLSDYGNNGLLCGISGLIYAICKFGCYDQIPNILELRCQ